MRALVIAALLSAVCGCAPEAPAPVFAPEAIETPAPAPSAVPTPAPTPEPTPEPTSEPEPTPPHILPEKLEQFADWITRNGDFTGWLTVPDTRMDYPVVYGADYVFYVENDFDKKPSQKGAVFTDYRNPPDDPGRHIILFAHHMKDGSMFGSLEKFNDLEFVREHPVFTYDTLYGTRRYQVFAVLIVPMDYNYYEVEFDGPDDFLAFTDHMRALSLYTTDLEISGTDEMITLSTCWYDFKNARFAVQAILLPDGVEEVPAVYEQNTNIQKPWEKNR